MQVQTVILKIKLRLNKSDSQDYDLFEDFQLTEAYNKAQSDWVRRQLVGTNILHQGDEESEHRIDDLNILLKTRKLTMSKANLYYESNSLPWLTSDEYMAFKRLEVYATSDCCKDPRMMIIYLVEESNIPNYLTDDNKKPSFEWGETIGTMVGRKVRIYTNNEFDVSSTSLMYYRQPRKIQIAGVSDPYTGLISAADVIPEFKDDVVETIIDDAAAILAKDIENYNMAQLTKQTAENNN